MRAWWKETLRYTKGYLAVGATSIPFAFLYALGEQGHDWAHLLCTFIASWWLAGKAWNRVVYGHKHSVVVAMNHNTATQGVLIHCSIAPRVVPVEEP